MSQFALENAINDATRLDAPMQRGPLMRWQRKALEAGVRSLSLSDNNLNTSGLSGPRSALSAKTPNAFTPKTPCSGRLTPSRGLLEKSMSLDCLTPGKEKKSPWKNNGNKSASGKAKTPKLGSENMPPSHDRFIPNRAATDMETAHYLLTANDNVEADPETEKAVAEALGDTSMQDKKILAFCQKAPQSKDGHINNMKVLYSSAPKTGPKAANVRQVSQQPIRIMDAPELIDDYYLHLLSWSSQNFLAVSLGRGVYIWDAEKGSVTELFELPDVDEYISSLSWVTEGGFLAVGNSLGAVQLWDVNQGKLMRTMGGHAARVGSLCWNSYILSSGSRSGAIHHHDVRVAEHNVGSLNVHTQEVCGLTWAPNGRLLASGGNDNMLCIWDQNMANSTSPLHTLTEHQAAVKALAWCPWQPTMLASGGGSADRNMRFWNATSGACLNSIDTGSQVCAILWSTPYKELISAHGFSKNQLTIWKYPSMNRVTDLVGHQARILELAMSPDGTTVASAAADETIRLWRCFEVDKKQRKTSKSTADTGKSTSILRGNIR